MYGYYELKQTTTYVISYAKLEIHQYDGLQATEKEGLVWKFSDEDQRQKPCDCMSAPPLPSYLVIKFPDAFYVIRIKDVVILREEGGLGITRDLAKKVAEKIVTLST
jgi:hypothetical protein